MTVSAPCRALRVHAWVALLLLITACMRPSAVPARFQGASKTAGWHGTGLLAAHACALAHASSLKQCTAPQHEGLAQLVSGWSQSQLLGLVKPHQTGSQGLRACAHLAVQQDAVVRRAADDGHALAGGVKLQDIQNLVLQLCDAVPHALLDQNGGGAAAVEEEAKHLGCYHKS